MSKQPVWKDTSWIDVGESVFYSNRPVGQKCIGIDRGDGSTAWIVGGAPGLVVEAPRGGRPRQRCPDHELGECDCACGGNGWLAAKATYAVVAWSMDDGGSPLRRLIYRDGEGTEWRRLEKCGEPGETRA